MSNFHDDIASFILWQVLDALDISNVVTHALRCSRVPVDRWDVMLDDPGDKVYYPSYNIQGRI